MLLFQPLAKSIATRTDYNDQIKCGLDIISRINYAKRPERLAELRLLVLKTINRLIKKASASQKIKTEEICNAVISGNTTMIHLLLGLNPDYIRLDPYTPTILNTQNLSAVDIGIDINPKSWIYISPGVGSYVGGDITAGLLCTDLASDTEDINLFIDIGTNGEIVVGNSDFLMGCACSAGPAFEGGGIRDGMRASLGAISIIVNSPFYKFFCRFKCIFCIKRDVSCTNCLCYVKSRNNFGMVRISNIRKTGHTTLNINNHHFNRTGNNGKFLLQKTPCHRDSMSH
ncbi:hypothetical protein ES705_51165 [subsurface metagenome]